MLKTCVAVLAGLGCLYVARGIFAVYAFPAQLDAGVGYSRPERFGVASLGVHWWYASKWDNEHVLGVGLDWRERDSEQHHSWTAPDVSEWWRLIVYARTGAALDLELVSHDGERTWWRLDSATGAGARLDTAPSQRPALTLNSLHREFVDLD